MALSKGKAVEQSHTGNPVKRRRLTGDQWNWLRENRQLLIPIVRAAVDLGWTIEQLRQWVEDNATATPSAISTRRKPMRIGTMAQLTDEESKLWRKWGCTTLKQFRKLQREATK
jgi:hypothetical protein